MAENSAPVDQVPRNTESTEKSSSHKDTSNINGNPQGQVSSKSSDIDPANDSQHKQTHRSKLSSSSKSSGGPTEAEKRAKYELERKKVAKYKEDKLKARRDHTKLMLENHAQAKRRALLGKQSEFLVNLEFRNTLPDIAFDTKFMAYPHESERLVKYKPNMLELDFAYDIHEDATLGLNIDLIDPAKYEVPDPPPPLTAGDKQSLMMKDMNAKKKKKSDRPNVSWLRRTEYMGNDLYDAVHKFKSEVEIQTALREGTESALAEVVADNIELRAEKSFLDINDEATLVHPYNKDMKIAKVWEVFPDPELSANHYTILSYDVLPSHDVKKKSMIAKEESALVCTSVRKNHAGETILGSVLLPTNIPASSTDEETKDTDESKEYLTGKYAHFRDYQLSIDALDRTVKDEQHCLLLLDPESDEFTYVDLQHRIQLKKTKSVVTDANEEKALRLQGVNVRRREYSEGETERIQSILFDAGGLYDESLDDPEVIQQYKRQKTEDIRSSEQDVETKEIKAENPVSPIISDDNSE